MFIHKYLKGCRNLLLAVLASQFLLAEAQSSVCEKQQSTEPLVYRTHFLAESISDLEVEYKKLYASGRRLKGRFYWSETLKSYVADRPEGTILIASKFIENFTRQIETALKRGYADFLFYPDMGHAHVLIPIKDDVRFKNLGFRKTPEENLFKTPELKVLYHTAELLRLRSGSTFNGPVSSDPWLAWRYHSRNFVGSNTGEADLAVVFGGANGGYNTVRSLNGYVEAATVYMSASKDGCFQAVVDGETIFFDVTLDIPSTIKALE